MAAKKKAKSIDAVLNDLTAESPVSGKVEAAKALAILPLSIDFNKEDLNTLVSKVNEIISYLNK